jgi:hypothetical protein
MIVLWILIMKLYFKVEVFWDVHHVMPEDLADYIFRVNAGILHNTTWCHNAEDLTLNLHHHENPKSCMRLQSLGS